MFTDVGLVLGMGDRKGLQNVVVVVTDRREMGRSTSEIRCYICSRKAPAEVPAKALRDHWGIENNLHWHLDVTFGDEGSRMLAGNGAENFARIKRLAFRILTNASGREFPAKKRLAACASDERRELVIREFLTIPEDYYAIPLIPVAGVHAIPVSPKVVDSPDRPGHEGEKTQLVVRVGERRQPLDLPLQTVDQDVDELEEHVRKPDQRQRLFPQPIRHDRLGKSVFLDREKGGYHGNTRIRS